MNISRSVATITLALTMAAGAAWAQGTPARPTTVSVFGGVQAGGLDAGPAIGASVTQDIGERLSVEGSVTFADRGRGASTTRGEGSVLVHLGPTGGGAVPFVAVGLGVYHTSVDLAAARFLGAIGPQYAVNQQACPAAGPSGPGPRGGFGPGDGLGAGAETCPNAVSLGWGVGDLPLFYARRLGPLAVPASGAWGSRDFTDASFSLGGGLRLDVSERVTIRPEARAVIVFGGGDTHTVGEVGIRLGYRF